MEDDNNNHQPCIYYVYTKHDKKSGQASITLVTKPLTLESMSGFGHTFGAINNHEQLIIKLLGLTNYKMSPIYNNGDVIINVRSIHEAKPVRYDNLVADLKVLVEEVKVPEERHSIDYRPTSSIEEAKQQQSSHKKKGWFSWFW